MSRHVFNGDVALTLELVAKGEQVFCPVCGAGLWVRAGTESGHQPPIHPGIQCPNNPAHVQVLLNIGSTALLNRLFPGGRTDDTGPSKKPGPR